MEAVLEKAIRKAEMFAKQAGEHPGLEFQDFIESIHPGAFRRLEKEFRDGKRVLSSLFTSWVFKCNTPEKIILFLCEDAEPILALNIRERIESAVKQTRENGGDGWDQFTAARKEADAVSDLYSTMLVEQPKQVM
jgi:hypothetical protein